MRRLPSLSLLFPLISATALPLAAQSIRVRTVETQTGRSIAGALVVLIDSTGRRVVQGLTDESGRIVFAAPAPGRYRLKADRIGHPGVLGDYFPSDNPGSITIEMPADRVELPELAVAATSECRRESEETAQLWDEVRKALAVSELTASSEAVPLMVRRFIRYRALNGSLRSDSTTETFSTRLSPFVTADPASLLERGFIQSERGSYRFLGPDATLLLSDGFLETHCFRLARAGRDMPGLIGLGFEPVKGRNVPEIRGALWVDRASAELRTLSWEYLNAPSAVRAEGLGGRVEFERLGSGGWIIRDWYIRVPDRVDLQRRIAARRPASAVADTIVGFIDIGGSARAEGDASVLVSEHVAGTSEASLSLRDVRIKLASSRGGPVEGALIAVAELDTTLTSGASGEATIGDVSSNRVRLRIRAIGYAPRSAEIPLNGDRRLVDTTLVLTAEAQPLDPVVVTAPAPVVLGKMAGFARRRNEGFGAFLDSVELANPNKNTLDKHLRQMGRVRVVYCRQAYAVASRTAGTPQNDKAGCGVDLCLLSVYLDGVLYYHPSMGGLFDPTQVQTDRLQGVEVYFGPASMPVEYNATGSSCGVILLWTK